MEKRHTDALNNLFDEVEDRGAAIITDAQVRRWWDRQRVTAGVWADLRDRWAENREASLKIGTINGGYLLVWGDDFLEPLDDWCSGAAE